MINQTILINVRASIRVSQQTIGILRLHYKENQKLSWFCSKDGNEIYFNQKVFFTEYRRLWNDCLIESCQPEFDDFFCKLGWNTNFIEYPQITILETYEGSWIIEAAVIVAASVTTTYAVIKAISEIPDMIEGLQKLKEKIATKFQKKVNIKAIEIIDVEDLLELPEAFGTDIIIDARPLEALSPKDLCEHSIHLKVNVTSSGIVIENLSDNAMKNLRIGLFNNQNEISQWHFADAYVKTVISLFGHQTMSIDFDSFKRAGYSRLDCWVQDETGIYLFNFLIPEN